MAVLVYRDGALECVLKLLFVNFVSGFEQIKVRVFSKAIFRHALDIAEVKRGR